MTRFLDKGLQTERSNRDCLLPPDPKPTGSVADWPRGQAQREQASILYPGVGIVQTGKLLQGI